MIQTEFEFTLPKGFIDKEGNLHRTGIMRLANARDEIAPLEDPRVHRNKAYLVIILLARVVRSLGDLKSINPNVIENLFSADLAYLQDFYRRINGNGHSLVTLECPECENRFEVDDQVFVSGEPVGV
jgi:hypothetical protein